jgi:methionine-rich copper-binding protein CopC
VAVTGYRAENGDPPSDQNFEEIEIAEEELIDAYVRNELSLDERKLVEKGLRTSPQLLERLHFARLLAEVADQASGREVSSYRLHDESRTRRESWWPFWLTPAPRPAFQLAFAAATLIVVIAGGGLLAGWISLRRQSQQLAAERAALEQQKLELERSAAEQHLTTDQMRAQLSELQQLRDADQKLIVELKRSQDQKSTSSYSPIGNFATFFLLPSSRGSGEENELSPPAAASKIRLQLGVDSIAYPNYLAVIKNSQDHETFQQKLRAPRSGKLVTVTIPHQLLGPGAYSLQLSGISADGETEPVGNYTFRITLKK